MQFAWFLSVSDEQEGDPSEKASSSISLYKTCWFEFRNFGIVFCTLHGFTKSMESPQSVVISHASHVNCSTPLYAKFLFCLLYAYHQLVKHSKLKTSVVNLCIIVKGDRLNFIFLYSIYCFLVNLIGLICQAKMPFCNVSSFWLVACCLWCKTFQSRVLLYFAHWMLLLLS